MHFHDIIVALLLQYKNKEMDESLCILQIKNRPECLYGIPVCG